MAAMAQDATPPTVRLDPAPMPGLDRGKAVVVKGISGKLPQRFALEGIDFLHPVAVALRPVKHGENVAMSVTKYAWNQPLREGETDGDILRYLFRTEGEFQVTVSAPNPGTHYRLMVWVGDELKPEMTPVVVPASEHDASGKGWMKWIIGAAVVFGLAVLALLLWRRKGTTA